MDTQEKSRKIPACEYLKILQLEFLTFKLRSKIYDRPEFIKMNSDIAEMKKEKVIDLGRKQGHRTIFDSEEEFNIFWTTQFLNKEGSPNLQYTPKNKTAASFYDKIYLYKAGDKCFYNGKKTKIVYNNTYIDSVRISGSDRYIPYIWIHLPIEHLITFDDLK